MTRTRPDPAPRRPPPARRLLAAVMASAALFGAAACGGDDPDEDGGLSGGGSEPSVSPDSAGTSGSAGGVRTVEVAMVDNEFEPARVEVPPGEPVRFVFTNEGEVTHDAVIGDEDVQAEHEDEMRAAEDDAMAGMDHGAEAEGEGGAITVEPGESGELTHTFTGGEAVLIGCHEPGHYEAGMRVDVAVAGA